MRILFIGDVVGGTGRRAIAAALPGLRETWRPDFVVANAENTAGGIGLTAPLADELLGLGVDVLTSGNHIWDRKGADELVTRCDRLLRPANYPPGTPGRGVGVFRAASGAPVGVVNLQGRVFMQDIDCPFRSATEIVGELASEAAVILVDFHAEATSEKVALAWHLAGKATAVLGTHTHVQTADDRILDGFTATISDVGMTGPYDSVIGVRKELSLARFLTHIPQRFETAGGRYTLNAVVVDADDATGAARAIDRIAILEEEGA